MNLRLTWVQPEDLVGHELRQAEEDGRDARAVRRRWLNAGGAPPPARSGASPHPAPPRLRTLAAELLDELAQLPSPLAAAEPTDLPSIMAACPDWPAPPARPRPGAPGPSGRSSEPDARAGAAVRPPGTARAGPDVPSPDVPKPDVPRCGESCGAQQHAPGRALAEPPRPTSAPGRSHGDIAAALHAAWLGRAAGCLLGRPVEKLPLDGIRALARATGNWPLTTWFTARGVPAELAAAHPWNRRGADGSLAENIDGMPEDDDLNYPLLHLLLLQRHGCGFRTADVGRLWLEQLPAGRAFTAERVAYRNLLCGLEPPLTAVHHNPFREWIGALIRADAHGWTHPGDPAAAAAQAHRDAALTHTANGVYGAMFLAAALAEAGTGTADVHQCLRTGLRVVPPSSRLAEAVRTGVETASAHRDFDTVVDRLHSAYGTYHWVHVVPNAALLTAALTHADGDFSASICRAVSAGLDTDSIGAAAGSLAGLLAGGPDALPEHWTAPLKNRLATSVPGFDGIGFDTLAQLTCQLTHQEALSP
ncbi:ADP-ribosylglycohydrolase family protein [Streptomyces sp. HNM0663]|uniref:ADP-ribosylglycohydrolase family protein n=1 Tax=Streptomyces chengmaiensis TaxID=3040919 RepID=A0ABT6HNM6_9ACTN|nr:ADP-ribosylglycohydrolase family protein [Streptomyces chengmaiensis]MDH2389956.1 ADP-ribosylglycohydrolase family protein [Streptomyces chengmaiensis]